MTLKVWLIYCYIFTALNYSFFVPDIGFQAFRLPAIFAQSYHLRGIACFLFRLLLAFDHGFRQPENAAAPCPFSPDNKKQAARLPEIPQIRDLRFTNIQACACLRRCAGKEDSAAAKRGFRQLASLAAFQAA